MKTLLKLLFVLLLSSTCNSQSIESKFITSINNTTKLTNTSITKTVGRVTVTYPNNLNSYFQNIIDQYVDNDLKRTDFCEGSNSILGFNYEVRYYGNKILSIYKTEYDDYCEFRNDEKFSSINLYYSDGFTYLMGFDFNSNLLKSIVNSSIVNLPSAEGCEKEYNYENSVMGLLIDNKSSVKCFIAASKICQTEFDIVLNEKFLVSKQIK